MAESTNQLLALAQAEAMAQSSRSQTRLDLTATASPVLEEVVQAAQRRCIDVGAKPDDSVQVAGNTGLLASLVSNLIDNAVRYTHKMAA